MSKILTSIFIVMASMAGIIYLANQSDSLSHVQVDWLIAIFETNLGFVIFDVIWFILCYITMLHCDVKAERKSKLFALCTFADILPYSFWWGCLSYQKGIYILWLIVSFLIILMPKVWEFSRLNKTYISPKDIPQNLLSFCMFPFTIYLMGCLLFYYLHDYLIGIFHLRLLANIFDEGTCIFTSLVAGACLGIYFIIRYRKIASLSSTQGYYYLLHIFCTFYSLFLVSDIIINATCFSIKRLFYYQLPYTILTVIMMGGIYLLINYKNSPTMITNRCKHFLSHKIVRNIFYLSIYFTIFYALLSLFDYWFAKRGSYLTYVFNLHFLTDRINMSPVELNIYITILIVIVCCISLLLSFSCIKKFKESYRKGFIHTGYTFLGIYFILTNCIHWISKFDYGIYCSWFGGHVYEGGILSNYILSLILCTYLVVLMHRLNHADKNG